MTDEILSPSYAPIPFAAAVALVAFTVAMVVRTRLARERATPGMIFWPLPFAGLLALMGALCSQGLCQFGSDTLIMYSVVIELLGAATLARAFIGPWLDRVGGGAHGVRLMRDIALLAFAAVISTWALEHAWNRQLAQIPVAFFAVSALIVFGLMLALYFLGQRSGVLATLPVVACAGFGTAQFFILRFKSAAILPSDLLALGTAAAVSGNYTYEIDIYVAEAIMGAAVALALLSFIWPGRPKSAARGMAGVVANLCAAAVVAGVLAGSFATVKLEDALGFEYDRWWPIATYERYGFLPSFVAVAQDLPIPEPDGYSDEDALAAQTELAATYDATLGATPERIAAEQQFAEVQPTVIAIMNESFSDLSIYEGLKAAGYNGPGFYNSLADTLQRGTLMTSVNGGGTANSEFEFLTGNSIAFIGNGKYPYQLYNLSDIECLPRQLEELGYRARAIHPQAPTNWNRALSYKQMGFEEFYSMEDFEGAPQYHSGATDRSTYDKILELLAEDDGPQFILDITMQNHSGYDAGTVPAEELTSYAPAGVTDGELLTQLNTYLTCINASDRDLAYFVDQLRQLDRPVVLVFFGDHQPNMTTSLNDALYPGEDELTHQWRLFQSTYFIWANYDVAGNDQVSAQSEIGASALAAQVLHAIGAPLTDYQKALLASRSQIVSLSANGYRGADGVCYTLDAEGPYRSLVDDLRAVQYLNFARKVN